jgi:ATP-dependent helicase HrpB
MPELPINAVIPSVQQTLSSETRLVVSAPPGAGKTTGIPPALLDASWLGSRKIIMLEPRRLAARAAAQRIARMLGETVGQTVGYRIRLESRVSKATRIEIVTEGILTRILQQDPMLEEVALVIFDEFHERSIHADLGLALCLEVQKELREDLRLMVMSATLDTDTVARLLGNSPVIQSAGRMFPVETRYIAADSTGDPIRASITAVRKALREESGSILVFLPGGREIRMVHRRLVEGGLDPTVHVYPLYGALGREAQDKAISPPPEGIRKVVLATSIAETSLTIEGVRIVIDAGLMRVPRFDVQSAMSRLETIPVSRDSADQRRGRAGRLESGICYRLWSEGRHQTLLERSSPEILSTDLSPLALELAAWGVSTPEALSWIDPPPTSAFTQARELLSQLGALDNGGRITGHGRQMTTFGLPPRLSHMLVASKGAGMGSLACKVAAVLGERDFLGADSGGKDSDLRLRIEALDDVPVKGRPLFHGMRVNATARRMILKTATHLRSRLGCHDKGEDIDNVGLILSFAYPDRIAVRRPGDMPRYQLSNGRGAFFSSPEPLSAETCLAIAELDGVRQESMIFLAAPLSIDSLLRHHSDRIIEQETVSWDKRSQAVLSRSQVLLGKAVLKDSPLASPSPDLVADAMCEGIRQLGLDILPWTKQLRKWQARVLLLKEVNVGRISWPDVSDGTLLETLDTWLHPFLPGISRREQLQRLDLKAALTALLPWREQTALDRFAPTHITVPSGSRIPITYTPGDSPVLAVRLQEMFGATDTPAIADNKIPLTLHLLSPAGRPVQVTQNLRSFWESAYFEVKKDLKGRYPKHHWPDNPLTASPTNRTKKGARAHKIIKS